MQNPDTSLGNTATGKAEGPPSTSNAFVHPAVTAWREWKSERGDYFSGSPSGVYLENRIQAAFMGGWEALEARIQAALTSKP